MNRRKLNRKFDATGMQWDFVLDAGEDLDAVLTYFSLHPEVDEEERTQLFRDLFPLATESELAEMGKLAAS